MIEDILEAAKELLNEGADKVTIRNIVKSLNYSPGSVYYYFKNKDEILRAIYLETCREFLEEMKRIPNNHDVQSFVRLTVFMCRFRILNSKRYRELFSRQVDERVEELEKIRSYFIERLRELNLKMLDHDEKLWAASRVIQAMAEGLASKAILNPTEAKLREVESIMEMGVKSLIKAWS